jgi:hypothetical protein
VKGDRRYPAGVTTPPLVQLGQDIEHELRQLHRQVDAAGLQVCCTCTDSGGHPELWPCPTLRITRRLIRVRIAQ